MKKNIFILISTVMLLIPSITKADMAAPDVRPYDAYISNPDGVECKDYDGKSTKIPYEAKVKVTFEYFDKQNIASIEYKNYECEIKLKDLKTVNDKVEFKASDTVKNIKSDEVELIVLDKNGIEIRKGDSRAYDIIGEIPYGTKIKPELAVEGEMDYIWYGVDYNGTKGWIETLNGRVGFKAENDLKVYKEKNVYDSFDMSEENIFSKAQKIGSLKKDQTILSTEYYLLDAWSRSVIYINNVNGISGYMDYEYNILYSVDSSLTIYNETNIYEEPSLKSKKLGTIPKGVEVESTSTMVSDDNTTFYFVSYKGKKGWINSDEFESIDEEDDEPVEEDESEEEDVERTTTTTTNIGSTSKKTSAREMMMLSIIGALILAIVSIVTLILIKKKKSSR